MALFVQKYGGTSLADFQRIAEVADRIAAAVALGHQIVVVVSAMAGETDRLIEYAHQVSPQPDPREYAVLVATGEQASMALLCMALIDRGIAACSFTGQQAGIHTTDAYKKARILQVDENTIRQKLTLGQVVVVAGFQGVDEQGNITTLGRGGSDTSAVALAAALQATECQIYTDVDGVYTTDPRVVPGARRINRITFEEMLELASLGAKVLQIRAVDLAEKYKVPLRVLSSFNDSPGTLISFEDEKMEQPKVSGIAFNRSEAKLTILDVADRPGIASNILSAVSNAHIDVDMIVQNVGFDGTTDFTFTIHRDDYKQAFEIIRKVQKDLNTGDIIGDNNIAKISLIGVGMRSHPGIASDMFKVLGQEGINIQLITTSEIKVSVLVAEKYLELGVRALHDAFGLGKEPEEEFDPLSR